MPFILPYMCDSYYEMLHVSCYGDIVDQDKSHTWNTALNYDHQKKREVLVYFFSEHKLNLILWHFYLEAELVKEPENFTE